MQDNDGDDCQEFMLEELQDVLADPAFARSPVLARLLEYLVEASLRGEADRLKAYTIAVDALGKDPDFDSQSDSYARVAVARLRRALDSHYANAGASHPRRLSISSGSYEVRLVTQNGLATPPATPPRSSGMPVRWRQTWVLLAIAIVIMGIAAFGWHLRDQQQDAERRFRTSNFPYIEVVVTEDAGSVFGATAADDLLETMKSRLVRFEGIRVRSIPAPGTQYRLSLEPEQTRVGAALRYTLVDQLRHRELGGGVVQLPITGANADAWNAIVPDIAFRIAGSTGLVSQNGRRMFTSLQTPYGCWLRFTGRLTRSLTLGDDELAACAKDWYAAQPDHPLAAALRGWTLLDGSVAKLSQSQREDVIEQAMAILEPASMLYPDSCFLHLALMRANAYMGDKEAMKAHANHAIMCNPDNLDIKGALGTYLVLWNDPEGEQVMNTVLARHPNPPSWYQISPFISAMMHNDMGQAGLALERMGSGNHTTAAFHILSAAYLARSGKREQAAEAWAQAQNLQPLLRVNPEAMLERLPLAPEVRKRLLDWLAPLL